MTQSSTATPTDRTLIGDVVGPVTDRQTYRNLLYLALAFPLGLVYWVILIMGFVLGIALSVVVVGLAILLGTVVGIRGVAAFERALANRLLGTDIPDPTDVTPEGEGIVARARAYLEASSTWRGLGFVVLKFWIGVLSFVLLVTFVATAIELILLPVVPGGVFNTELNGWAVAESFETTTQRLFAVPAGAILGLVGLHIVNAFADANASIAASLLGGAVEG